MVANDAERNADKRAATLLDAASALRRLLEAENLALARGGMPSVESKEAAAEAFAAALLAMMELGGPPAEWRDRLVEVGNRIDAATAENEIRLAAEIEARRRIVSLVAEQAGADAPGAGTYRRDGLVTGGAASVVVNGSF
jgi:hypothetical protein